MVNYNKRSLCPECKGSKVLVTEDILVEECFFCEGTGFALDEDTEQKLHKYGNDW